MFRYPMCFMAFIALIFTTTARAAFEVRAEVNSGTVRWDNVTRYNGKMLPSTWGTPPTLQASETWAAATFSGVPPTEMILIGGDGDVSPSIAVNILGVQYNTAGMEFAQSVNPVGGGCSFDEVNLPTVTVEGTSCISSFRLINKQKSSPFVFFRPIFEIDESEIISALTGLSEGVYSTSVPINIRYYYENDGIMTYRNINEVIIFSFDYQPVQLDNVFVSGDGVMTPVYDTLAKRITSTTSFDITANGYFNDGIILTIPQQTYELVNSNSPEVTIPYSINCAQCAPVNLVEQGQLINQTAAISEGAGVQTSINFSLDFDYDIDGSKLVSGDYFDEVTIMLEPSI